MENWPSPFLRRDETAGSTGTPRDRSRRAFADIDTAMFVGRIQRMRALRVRYVSKDMFADPAWDMMLDLYKAHLEGRTISVSSACIAANVPPTTALRYLTQLCDRDLVVRQPDHLDGRRIFVQLSTAGLEAMDRWAFVAQST